MVPVSGGAGESETRPHFAVTTRYHLGYQGKEVVQLLNDPNGSCGTLEVAGR